MNILRRIVENFLHGHGRVAGFPLYRYLAFFSTVSSVIQLVTWSVPQSVENAMPEWYYFIFVGLQLLGSLLILIAILAMENTPDSAHVERAGALITATIGMVYFISVCLFIGSIPVSQGTWLAFAFSLFCFVRAWQVTAELREVGIIVDQENKEHQERWEE